MTRGNYILNRARVSIAERLIPSLSYAAAAASGIVGGVMILKILNGMRTAELAGAQSFFLASARLEATVGTVLLVAAAIGAVGILVAGIRLFTKNTKASPPGVLYLPLGLLALVPPFAVHYVMHSMEHFVATGSGDAIVGERGTMISYAVIGASVLSGFVLLAFSLIPFNARLGRKFSSVAVLIIVEIAVVALCATFFWQATQAMSHTGVKIG